jgi:hypothetical protein
LTGYLGLLENISSSSNWFFYPPPPPRSIPNILDKAFYLVGPPLILLTIGAAGSGLTGAVYGRSFYFFNSSASFFNFSSYFAFSSNYFFFSSSSFFFFKLSSSFFFYKFVACVSYLDVLDG